MIAASEAITPPTISSRASAFEPRLGVVRHHLAKNIAVSARYQEVTSQ